MPIETYPQSAFVASGGLVACDSLSQEVAAALPPPAPQLVAAPLVTLQNDAVPVVGIVVIFDFSAALSPAEVLTLDGVVAAHTGTPLPETRQTMMLSPGLTAVLTAAPAFQVLGSVVFEPEDLAPLDQIKVVARGGIITTLAGAVLQIVEVSSGGTTVIGTAVLPSTLGALVSFELFSSVDPSPGLNTYRLEANLGGIPLLVFSVDGMALAFVETAP